MSDLAPTVHRMRVAEAARYAGVTEQTIRRWIRTGRLNAHYAGRVLRVDQNDLDRALRPATPNESPKFRAWVDRAVASMPPLSAEERAEIAMIIFGGRRGDRR